MKDGNVTYQCRFIQTDSYKQRFRKTPAQMISFGSQPVRDPCQTIFQRVASIFQPAALTDNTMISIYPFGDEYYAFTECPVIQRYYNNITTNQLPFAQSSSFISSISSMQFWFSYAYSRNAPPFIERNATETASMANMYTLHTIILYTSYTSLR